VDLLVIDEGCFVPPDVWQAARWTVVARPGSRVILASTPFGRKDSWFSVEHRAGERGVDGRESFHWPSTVSPLVDETLLAMWKETSTTREYEAEVEAKWVDDEGAYFSAGELEAAVRDYALIRPAQADGTAVEAGGVDWGLARDANALVFVGVHDDDTTRETFYIPFLDERFGVPYGHFVDEVVAACQGYRVRHLVSETNGVGAMPTDELRRRLAEARVPTPVESIHSTTATKEDGFGALKMLLQQGRLLLPRHPALLRQLAALEFTTLESGMTRIAVPERSGHDDLADALALAGHRLMARARRRRPISPAVHAAVAEANRSMHRTSPWR
jgi:hypothetical protein